MLLPAVSHNNATDAIQEALQCGQGQVCFYYDVTATSGVLLLPNTPVKVTRHWLSGSLGDGSIVDDFTRSVPELISLHYEDTGPLHLLHHLLS